MSDILWSPGVTLEQAKQQIVQKAFVYFKKNKTSTAAALGIAIRTLDSVLEKIAEQESQRETAQAALREKGQEYLARARGYVQAHAVPLPPRPVVVEQEEIQITEFKGKKRG